MINKNKNKMQHITLLCMETDVYEILYYAISFQPYVIKVYITATTSIMSCIDKLPSRSLDIALFIGSGCVMFSILSVSTMIAKSGCQLSAV